MTERTYPALNAIRKGRRWHIERARTVQPTIGEADRARAEAQINARLAGLEARLGQFDPAWRQELPLTAYNEALTAYAMGEEWAEELAVSLPESARISGMDGEVSRFVVASALERQGQPVAGGAFRRASIFAVSSLALLAALAWLALLSIRSLRHPALRAAQAKTVVALHAEEVNRTKHVRAALAQCDPAETRVLLVGRPHLSAPAVRAMLDRAGWDGEYALAWDWKSVLGGLLGGLRIALQGARAMRRSGFRPKLAQLVAIHLRILLGSASAWRWRRSISDVQSVVFGHTGRADTILLEQAMQRSGAKTVHWMHGVSVGRAFQGISDLCVTHCAHDSRWHDRELGYGRNIHFPMTKPAFRTGTKPGWVVLTNMTHPGYTYFPSLGPEHELRLIDMIEELAREEGSDPAKITWKPHPVFYQQDPDVRRLVAARLDSAGFALWPDPAMPFDLIAEYETLIVTPSGAALDLLKVGRLPVMAAFQPVDPEHVLAQLEPTARDLATLQEALAVTRDAEASAHLFDEVWDHIGPGVMPTIAQIRRELQR